MIVRRADKKDVSMIRSLLHQLGYASLDDEAIAQKIIDYRKPNYCILVSESTHGVTGFISLHCFEVFHSPGKIGRITAFCVDEAVRGQGVGIQLLEAADKYFIQEGCTKLEVTSNIRRAATHEFYLRRGYIEDSRRFVKYLKY
jgi:GNAT superfamily N-acetyltransferase